MRILGGLQMQLPQLSRLLHTSCACRAVDKSLLSQLRKKTGFPFIKCKKALEQHDNDINQAEAWLKEQAQKEGWVKATKLQGRPMSQGLIGLLVKQNNGVMVEVNCETDFVARNSNFQGLVSKIAHTCLEFSKSMSQPKALLDREAISQLQTKDGKSLADLVALEVGNIGENMKLRRGVCFQAPNPSLIGYYVHSTGLAGASSMDHCLMGKYGSLLIFNQSETGEPQLSPVEIGRQLGQHIVGMNPAEIGDINSEEHVKDESENAEESETSSSSDSEADEAKGSEEESSSSSSSDSEEEQQEKGSKEETRMVFQEFLLEPDLTVKEFLEQNAVEILDFARFECGEEEPTSEEKQTENETLKQAAQ